MNFTHIVLNFSDIVLSNKTFFFLRETLVQTFVQLQMCFLALSILLTPLSLCFRWSVFCQANAVQGICDHAWSLSAALWKKNGWPYFYTSLDGGNLLVSCHFVSTGYVNVLLLIRPHYSCEWLICRRWSQTGRIILIHLKREVKIHMHKLTLSLCQLYTDKKKSKH